MRSGIFVNFFHYCMYSAQNTVDVQQVILELENQDTIMIIELKSKPLIGFTKN